MKHGRTRSLAGVAALLVGLGGFTPAQAAGTDWPACTMRIGSATAGGDHRWQEVVADVNPPRTVNRISAPKLFPAGATRLLADVGTEFDEHGPTQYARGWQVIGSDLHWYRYMLDTPQPNPTTTKVGGGWGSFKTLNTSRYEGRVTNYALNENGTLHRWSAPTDAPGPWRATGTFTGFSSVKSLALFSQTATYDTLLALTSTGALYTIRIPLAANAKPITTAVRPAGFWKNAEQLITYGCGVGKTVVLVRDNLNEAPGAHFVGRANGTNTTFEHVGLVSDNGEPAEFADPVYNRVNSNYVQGD